MARRGTPPGVGGRRSLPAEGNIEDQPFFVLSSGAAPGDGKILRLWESRFVDAKGEERIRRHRWEVRESRGLGLPGRMEQDVYVALLELLERRGGIPENGTVYFTLYELLKVMGWPPEGEQYRRLKRALKCISSTTIDSQRAFYSKRLKQYITDNFQLFSVHFGHAEDDEGNRVFERTHVIFHPYYRDSYEEDYLGRLDASFYWSLRQHTSKRLYRLLDRLAIEREDGKPRTCEIDLFDLRDRLPLGDYGYPSQVKEKLDGAHEELEEKGFLQSVTFREHKEGGRKRLMVRYRLSRRFSARTFTKAIDLTEDQRDAVEQLVGWRVDRRVAEEKVLLVGADHCRRWAELLHFQDGVDPVRAPALLVWAIKEEPEEWEERAERKRRGLRDVRVSGAGGPKPEGAAGGRRGVEEGFEWLFGVGEGSRTDPPAPHPTSGPGEEPADAEPLFPDHAPHSAESAHRAWRRTVWDLLAGDGAREVDEAWFEPYAGFFLEGGFLVVESPDKGSADEVIRRFGDDFARLWRVRAGQEARVIVGPPDECRLLVASLAADAGGAPGSGEDPL